MRRFGAMMLVTTLLTTLLAGCSARPAGESPQRLYFDVIPTQASEKYREQIESLGRFLSAQSGLDLKVRIGTDYATVVEAMRFGKSDLAYFGPFTYVVANAQSGAQAFVTLNIKGKPYYHSYAIVRTDSPIQALTDQGLTALKGKTIALGDPASTSSSQIPQLALQNAGLDRTKDVNIVFTHAHDAVFKSVVARQADIGFLDSAIFEGSIARKFATDYPKVRVVWKSVALYQYPIAHRKGLDAATVRKLQEAFLQVTDPNLLEPFGADSFVVTDDAKYDPIRDAAAALGIDLSSHSLKKK